MVAILSNSLLLLTVPTGIKAEPSSSHHFIFTTTIGQPGLLSAAIDTPLIKTKRDSSATAVKIAEAPAIPINAQAAAFINNYLKKNRTALSKLKVKSPSYFKIMDSVFCTYDLPLELKYLAVIESELKTTATSYVGAKGLWQLMPSTARLLGLKITKGRDERTHSYKSTVAAAKYLQGLYNEFGDWLLVIAAYNAGPGTIHRAIKRSGSTNFWKLQYQLPAQTRMHVKRFVGTHYYFEGQGGITTLTKAEAIKHLKALTAFEEEQNSNAAPLLANQP